MRCHICDRVITEPRYNSELKGYEPCDPCLEIIQDTLAGYTDRPSVEEDEFGQFELPLETAIRVADPDSEIP